MSEFPRTRPDHGTEPGTWAEDVQARLHGAVLGIVTKAQAEQEKAMIAELAEAMGADPASDWEQLLVVVQEAMDTIDRITVAPDGDPPRRT